MKATAPLLGALLLAGLACPSAHAQFDGYPPSPFGYPRPPAPDACGPGYIALNCCGCPYGPNYCLRPPWEPFNGLRPGLGGPAGLPSPASLPQLGMGGQPSFPTHPFARSPRDYFMWTEVSEEEAARRRMPALIP
jgi:hypothetical protein